METAFEVAKNNVSGPKLVLYKGKRHARIGDAHQVDITGEDHLRRHLPLSSLVRRLATITTCSRERHTGAVLHCGEITSLGHQPLT